MTLSKVSREFYDSRRGVLPERQGGWVPGEAVYCRGHDMMEDLVGHRHFFQTSVLNIVGRLPELRFAKWMEAACTCVSWPDPRIWCNQVGAFAAMARTTVNAATSLGNLAADSVMYGQGTLPIGARFIRRLYAEHLETGLSVEQIIDAEIQRKGGKLAMMGYVP